MAKTYHFKGGYIQTGNKIEKSHSIYKIVCIIWFVLTFVLIFMFTEHVFACSLSVINYYEVISLGAVFATIGSSLISITSLSSSYFFEEYKKTKENLLSYNDNVKTANAWNFIQNSKILLKSSKHIIAYKKIPLEIVFEFGTNNLAVIIPSSKKEVNILKLISSFVKMKISEKLYFEMLTQNSCSLEKSGLFVWECTVYMLKTALLYKIFIFLTILGGMFFLSGLLAIFTHSYLNP